MSRTVSQSQSCELYADVGKTARPTNWLRRWLDAVVDGEKKRGLSIFDPVVLFWLEKAAGKKHVQEQLLINIVGNLNHG